MMAAVKSGFCLFLSNLSLIYSTWTLLVNHELRDICDISLPIDISTMATKQNGVI
jgi:hypothetical protein